MLRVEIFIKNLSTEAVRFTKAIYAITLEIKAQMRSHKNISGK